MTNREVMQQALEALQYGKPNKAITILREALEQPEQEPVTCRFCHDSKGCWTWQCYHCGEIDNVQKPAPPAAQREPVPMRMPKVGDKVICLEDESLGEVVSLTAGGSPDVTFDDGSRGTYMLREFAELFGYVNSPAPQRKPLTANEILNLMPSSIPAEYDGPLMEFARAIEALHNTKEGT